MLLSQYILGLRRLINDAQKNYWSDAELTDYINEARRKTAVDTFCVREFQTATFPVTSSPQPLSSGIFTYAASTIWSGLPNGDNTVDIINLTLIWGATRVPLRYYPYTVFSAYFRPWTNLVRLPMAFTTYNASNFWIAPPPDQAYVGEFDTAVIPFNLVTDNNVDAIPIPYSEAVKYYAARLARYKLQQYSEADKQESNYTKRVAELNAMYPRRIPYVYSEDMVF